MNRRSFVRSLCRTAAVFASDDLLRGVPLGVQFVNVAREAGLRSPTIYGSERRNKYLIETTGCGAAFFDYDGDGWLDIFLVNGTRFETRWPAGAAPVSRLYKNNRDGTFTDVTVAAGLARAGWGSGCCVGDFDNDSHDDLFVTYWGDCALWKNLGNCKFVDVAAKAGVTTRTAPGLKRSATSICSWPTTLTSTRRLRHFPSPARASTRGCSWLAVGRGCRAARILFSAIAATARLKMFRSRQASSTRRAPMGSAWR